MRGAWEQGRERPVRLVQFTCFFHVGGTETQLVELLRGLPPHYQVGVGVLQAEGALLEQVRALGHAPRVFPLQGSLARPNTARQVWRLAHWLAAQGCELVHVHDFYSAILVLPAARLAGARVVIGRLDLGHWLGPSRQALFAHLTRGADGVVANAQAIRTLLVEQEGVAPERIHVIPNGLDLARFDARARAGLQAPLPDTQGEPVVVHVANMSHPVKRQEDLLEALGQLRAKGVRLHVFFVGEGARLPMLAARARVLGLGRWAHFLGPRLDVPAIWARATLGVLCSSAEGMSNAVMEGMAAGRPMVVTRVGGNPELIAHGVHGLLVEKERPTQLAEALAALLADPERARRLGRAARAHVARELSLRRLVERHDALYQRVLGDAPPETALPLAAC